MCEGGSVPVSALIGESDASARPSPASREVDHEFDDYPDTRDTPEHRREARS